MDQTRSRAERLLRLFERLRPQLVGPTFKRLHDLDLSPSHMRVLRALDGEASLAMKDLADLLCIKPPSLTALTRRLVATGLVARHTHAEDSRVVLLALTDEGRDLHRALYAEHLAGMARLLARLDPAEQQTLLDLLEQVTTEEGASPRCKPL